MIELTNQRIKQILHEETAEKAEVTTIMRAIYGRYMHLYEKYFADIDKLNDKEIKKLREYHEETKSLVKYYYMDIPEDVCTGINKFEDNYSSKLLGPDWHDFLFDYYEEFKNKNKKKSEADLKAEFRDKIMSAFYETMEYIFRPAFDTESSTGKKIVDGIAGLLFGEMKSSK